LKLETDISNIELSAMDERFVTRYADGGISLERAQQYFREKRDLIVNYQRLKSLACYKPRERRTIG